MKNHLSMIAAASLGFLAGAAYAGPSGGNFEIVSYTIDGGGVIDASGGNFSLSGTVGQPDASGPLTGGAFELAGGFWPGVSPVVCVADLAAPFGVLNLQDLFAYIALFNASDPAADLAAPFGTLNLQDLFAYIASFNAGCP